MHLPLLGLYLISLWLCATNGGASSTGTFEDKLLSLRKDRRMEKGTTENEVVLLPGDFSSASLEVIQNSRVEFLREGLSVLVMQNETDQITIDER